MLTVSYGVENTSRKTAELHLSVDETSTAAQIHDYMGRSLHHLREPAILLLKVSLSASFYNAIILHILSGARGALDAEVFSELSKMLSGAEAESADVPRMIKELGRVLRESPEKEKFLKMTSEAAAASPQVEQKASSASWDASKVPYKLSTFQRALLTLVAPKARAAVEAREAAKPATAVPEHAWLHRNTRASYAQTAVEQAESGTRIARPVFQLTQEHRPRVDGQLGSFGTKAQTKHRLRPA
ncbi:hypothetical protein HPB49_021819 [Dermacentor silvarum]|uniref:Uncharacterized protein n=1 Tax=Dermacentor silvarum TaxID=543639 RepID=A0ACB8DGD8_DERSI|nr:hypothetical protein HPB49_021819 [Dermacentor silvarum]